MAWKRGETWEYHEAKVSCHLALVSFIGSWAFYLLKRVTNPHVVGLTTEQYIYRLHLQEWIDLMAFAAILGGIFGFVAVYHELGLWNEREQREEAVREREAAHAGNKGL